MSSWRETWQFVLILIAIATAGFALHITALHLLELDFDKQGLIVAYVANIVMAATILGALMRLPERLQDSLGFLYLGGSMVKFVVYFVFFYPIYKEDGDLSKLEFTTFFVPYSLCLIAETTVLIRKLNKQA